MNTDASVVYTAPATTMTQQMTLTAAVAGTKNAATVAITVNPDPTVNTNLPNGTLGVPYTTTLVTTGGTAPVKMTLSGTLPAGLSFNATTGVISGTPTAVEDLPFGIQLTDSSDVPYSAVTPEVIAVSATPMPLTVISGNPHAGTVGIVYATSLSASGGSAPYSWSIISGALPPGLSISATTGVISGTPTTAGISVFAAQAQDATGAKASAIFSITINAAIMPLMLTVTSLPNGTVGVPYSATIGVSGGTAPYSCIFTAGTLPAGLTLNGCVVSGTPTTAGTSALTVKATDSSSPMGTTSGPITITIVAAQSPLMLTTTSLPNGTVGVAYSATIGVSGGTAPYSCVFTSGTLPAGLTLTGCVVSGTPTTAGASPLTVKATDSSNPAETASGPENITITAAPTTLALTTSSLPNGTVGIAYSATIGVSGGTAPYACVFTAGTLPAGLSLAGCVVSGTPTAAGTSALTVKATDSSTPTQTVSGPESITIVAAGAPLILTVATLPNGTVGIPYSDTIGVSGGTAPYTCVFTAGTLPAGLALSGCVVSGTPTTAGTSALTVKATDSSNPVQTVSGPESITIDPAVVLVITSPPAATVGTPYSGTIPVSGGKGPYTCLIVSGTLPAGLSLSGCVISGTPTVAGNANLTIKATDSSTPASTTTGAITVTVNPAPTLTLSNPPTATVGTPYTGTIGVSGGTSPYTCLITAGVLPAGLTISNCTITGTPTTAGTTTPTVKATDSSNPAATTTGPVTITVAPAATLTVTSPPPATVGTPYNGPIGITGGHGPYTCVITAGTLPPGLTLSGCTIVGTPTASGATQVTVQVTDSSPTPIVTTAPITITVNPVPALTLTGSLPNAVVNMPYTQTLTATGGIAPYTYAVTAGTLPPGITMSPAGVVSGTPTTVGATSFTVTATDTEPTPQTASLPLVLLVTYAATPNDAELKGPYAYLFQGYDDSLIGVLAYQTATVASFTADGTGVVNAGEIDTNHQTSDPVGATVPTTTFLGTYQIGPDNRGLMTITTLNPDGTTAKTSTNAIALKAPVTPSTISMQGSLIEYDSDQLQGTKGSGLLLAQSATAITAGFNGSYVFGMKGDSPCLPSCTVGIIAGPAASVGQITTEGGIISSGTSDANAATTAYVDEGLTGSYGLPDANGRVQLSMTTAGVVEGVYPTDYAVYIVNANQAFVMSTDKHSAYILLAGSTQTRTQTTFSDASLTGPFIGYENSASNPGLLSGTLQNVANLSTATIFRDTATADGNCNVTNVDAGGITALTSALTGLGGSLLGLNNLLGTFTATGATTCAVAATGRATLVYPQQMVLGIALGTPPAPRVVYLSAPDTGYFLETSYAGLGNIEPQTGAPFSLATFDGTYVYGTTPASSVASIDSSGTVTANGDGSETSTIDENVGVGTLNILQLGVTGTSTYTTPDATTGRFVFNITDVIYAISPNRFVFVDTNPLTTSPSVTLLY